ncbi:hypothetical protein [Fulvimarina endophytica]|nr:hypothetical protein [Fulvimarina endophytica]
MDSCIETLTSILAEAGHDVASLNTQIRLPRRDFGDARRVHVLDRVQTLRSGVRIHEAVTPEALPE